jgi:1,4-dihydroxy-2-naphthoyl-CoA hydrolase
MKNNFTIEELNNLNKNTLMESLGIEYLDAGEGYVNARMPVDKKTLQPMGILHGGASLAFAETIGSLGSSLLINLEKYDVRGTSLTANHVKSVSKGYVYGFAKIIHRGKYTHVWNIDVKNENDILISSSRLTIMIIEKK